MLAQLQAVSIEAWVFLLGAFFQAASDVGISLGVA